ncbi:MAG: hypothetical protein VCD00_00775 [Candidatus Hydrogenedentota bacterium]
MDQRRIKTVTKKVIPLDGDKLGMIVGLLGAIAVLLIGIFANRGDLPAILIRAGWTFVICYGATFFLVRMILRTTLQEMIEQEKLEREQERALKKDQAKAEAEAEEQLPPEPVSE